jgi:hypothetical protein
VGRRPLDAVYGRGMSLEFQECLPWLANIKDADNVGVLRKCSEKVGIVWGSYGGERTDISILSGRNG